MTTSGQPTHTWLPIPDQAISDEGGDAPALVCAACALIWWPGELEPSLRCRTSKCGDP